MSCFRSGVLLYGDMRRMQVILNFFVDVPWMIEMIFGVVFVTVNDNSHLCKDSRNTRTWSSG